MSRYMIFLLLCITLIVCCTVVQAQVTVNAVCVTKGGWMADGWGSYKFTFKNDGKSEVKIVKWNGYWEVNGKPMGEPLSGEVNLTVAPGEEAEKEDCGYLPPDVAEKSRPGNPLIIGTFTIETGDNSTKELPFKLEIPEGKLSEATELIKGKYVGLELTPTQLKKLKDPEKTLRLFDQCYEAMHELTGYTPFDGKLTTIKECPRHPWWAYAGNPIVFNTDFVESTLLDFNNGILSFGLIHEIGHNFDMPNDIGNWYIWDGSICEMQANWKLVYAFETIKDRDFKVKWSKNKDAGYQPASKEVIVDGRQFPDSYFLFFGDGYLADPSRTWKSMSGDEFHSFLQRIVRVYGWEPFKAWYRTYDRFQKQGLKAPETAEEKVQLMAAILSYEIGVDLVPVFQRWRFPVTNEDIDAMMKKYPIDQKSTE